MKYGVTLGILGVALVVVSWQFLPWSIPLAWLGLNFLILGFAHACGWQEIFGKRPNGTLPWWRMAIFLPLLFYTSLVWHLFRLLSREPRINKVSDQLSVGRRLLVSEYPEGFANYVDLTAEFQESQIIRNTPAYFAFPILDASAPSPELLEEAVKRLRTGATFIHCAQGHG